MCDYSLHAIPNRLANEGEELVTHRFPTGSMGLAPAAELQTTTAAPEPACKTGFWSAIKSFLRSAYAPPLCAVCVPPGARLRMRDIPPHLQRELEIGAEEEVTFTQTTARVNSYRDAVRFSNGRVIHLQSLTEGQRLRVLSMDLAEWADPLAGSRTEELTYTFRR